MLSLLTLPALLLVAAPGVPAALATLFPVNGLPAGDPVLLVVLGFVVGVMVGLSGIGAGAIATPVLILLLGVPPATAVGCAIVAGLFTKAVGVWRHGRLGTVHSPLVFWLHSGSIPAAAAALFTLFAMRRMNLLLVDAWLSRAVGLALVLFGFCVLARDTGLVRRWQAEETHPQMRLRAVLIGIVVGFLFATTSIGTGSLLVVLLSIFVRMPEARVAGTSILYGLILSLFTAPFYIALGAVDWRVVGLLLLGSLPGAFLGSELTAHVPNKLLRVCFSLGAVWAGLRLV